MAQTLKIDVRVTLGGEKMPARWRLRLLGYAARLLRVPLDLSVTA